METEITINAFWIWFSENHKNFGDKFENEKLIEDLDNWILRLGNFSWEIGPGIDAENMLVISPGGNIELLSQTETIVSYAPKCDGWEFYSAKPPKNWDLIFNYYTESEKEMQIDASSWQYVLLRYSDGMFEIIIKATGLTGLDDRDRLAVAEILLDGILGEKKRITNIAEINVVTSFEEKYSNKSSNIKYLEDHMNKLLDN